MAQARKGGPSRPSLQPLSGPAIRGSSAIRRSPDSPQPVQLTLRAEETIRHLELQVPSPRLARVFASTAPLPPGTSVSVAALGRTLPFRQLFPDAPSEHFRRTATETSGSGVHGVSASFAGRHGARDAAGCRQAKLEYSFLETQGAGARIAVGNAQAKWGFDQLNWCFADFSVTVFHKNVSFAIIWIAT